MIRKRSPWVLPYKKRSKLNRRARETEAEIETLKGAGNWIEASHLQWVLRNAWWGYKQARKR